FKRVEIIDKATNETFNKNRLIAFINKKIEEVQSILIILNTKSVVRDLYTQLQRQKFNVPIYHLSTTMCAAHRQKILKEIRKRLNDGKKIICISTQLIEAGVDVSFECVIRSLSGLDSIAQAAGRCNRHGEKGIQNVYVIDYEEENLSRLKEIKIGKKNTKKILVDLKRNNKSHGGHILSREAMKRYFREYYTDFESDLNYLIPKLDKNMTELLSAPKIDNDYYKAYFHKHAKKAIPLFIVNSYRTAAEHFNVIDNLTSSVIAPYEEGKDIIAELNGSNSIEDLGRLLRKAQQYTVNLFNYEKEQLIKNNGLVYYLDGKILALKESAYSEEYGLNTHNESDFKTTIF
ncbi:helicase-related protein, partial [Bacillus toyonensis]